MTPSLFDDGLARIVKDDRFFRIESYEKDGITYLRHSLKGSHVPARLQFENEKKATQKVEGLPGVEQHVYAESPDFYVTKHPSGKPFIQTKTILPNYFDELRELVEMMHKKGVAGLNYENPNCLLVDALGNPVVTDLSKAIVYETIPTESRTPVQFRDIFPEAIPREYRSENPLHIHTLLWSRITDFLNKYRLKGRLRSFEEAIKLDHGYISYMKRKYIKDGWLTPKESTEADRFYFAKKGILNLKTP